MPKTNTWHLYACRYSTPPTPCKHWKWKHLLFPCKNYCSVARSH